MSNGGGSGASTPTFNVPGVGAITIKPWAQHNLYSTVHFGSPEAVMHRSANRVYVTFRAEEDDRRRLEDVVKQVAEGAEAACRRRGRRLIVEQARKVGKAIDAALRLSGCDVSWTKNRRRRQKRTLASTSTSRRSGPIR